VPGIVALLQDIVLLAWCWAVINLASSPERLRILLATWAYSSIAWAVLLFVGLAIGSATIAGQTAEEGSRTALTFADPSVSANYYFISIMIMWAAGFPRTIGLRLAASVLLFAALVSTGSNSAIVSVIVGAAVALLVGIYRRFGIAPAISALAFLVIGGYLAASATNAMGRGQTSVTQRDTLLRESLRLYETGGPLGGGPVSTKPRLENEGAPFVKEAHNDYLAALIERGAIGLLGFLILVAGLVVRTLAFAGGRLTGGFRAVVVRPSALVGAVAGTMVAEAVYELLHVRHVWTLFAFVAALYVSGRDWRGSATS
jgi:O-antigen ligase